MRITQKKSRGKHFSKTEANHWGHTAAMVKTHLPIPHNFFPIANVPIYIYKVCISIRMAQIRFLVVSKF